VKFAGRSAVQGARSFGFCDARDEEADREGYRRDDSEDEGDDDEHGRVIARRVAAAADRLIERLDRLLGGELDAVTGGRRSTHDDPRRDRGHDRNDKGGRDLPIPLVEAGDKKLKRAEQPRQHGTTKYEGRHAEGTRVERGGQALGFYSGAPQLASERIVERRIGLTTCIQPVKVLDQPLQLLTHDEPRYELHEEPGDVVQRADRCVRLHASRSVAVENFERPDHERVCRVESFWVTERPGR